MKKSNTKDVASHGNGSNNKATKCADQNGNKHDANLRKNGFLHFQVGLILAMTLVYMGLEASFTAWEKNIQDVDPIGETLTGYYLELDRIKVEKPKEDKTVGQKKLQNNFKEILDETATQEGTEFISKPNPMEGSLSIDSIAYVEKEKEVPTIMIDFLEEVPIFPGCEKVDKSQRKACFQEKLQKHILQNFKYPEPALHMGIKGRVNVTFKIGADGTVRDIALRGPSKILEDEAGRIIKKLPKMTPGKQQGRPVRVPYSIPIYFQLD